MDKIGLTLISDSEYIKLNNKKDFKLIKKLNFFFEIYHNSTTLDAFQKKSFTLSFGIKKVMKDFEIEIPKAKRIYNFFDKILINNFFVLYPGDPLEDNKSISIFQNEINKFNMGLTVKEIYSIVEDDLFKNLIDTFKTIGLTGDDKIVVSKEKKCLFCDDDDSTYSNIAHVIPEALGNVNITTEAECDSCNKKFGDGIERDLIEYLNALRGFWGIKGKKGKPQLNYANGINMSHVKLDKIDKIGITDKDEILVLSQILNEENSIDTLPNKIKLESKNQINYANIYRSLSKMAVELLPTEEVNYFKETIEWINEKKLNKDLPLVLQSIRPKIFIKNPSLILFVNKNDNKKFPHIIAEFKLWTNVFYFILPSSKDKKSFKTFFSEDEFKEVFTWFKTVKYSLTDFSLDEKRKFITNIKLDIVNN